MRKLEREGLREKRKGDLKMKREEAAATVVEVCEWLVANTRECARRLNVFFAYFGDGVGEMPDATYYPSNVLNPKLNGTCEKHRQLLTALTAFGSGELPPVCVTALCDCQKEVASFIAVLEDYKRLDSLSTSYTCVYDIVESLIHPSAVPQSARERRQMFRRKFRQLKESYYQNSRVWYSITTEILTAWGKRHPLVSRSVDDILVKLKGEAPPQPVVLVGVAKGVALTGGGRKRRAVSLASAVGLLKEACGKAQLADRAIGERTFRRWERGETAAKSGYTVACRDSLQAFLAWVQCYLAECRAELAAARAQERLFEDKLYRRRSV